MNTVLEQVRDFVKEQHELYVPSTEPELVDVPDMQFLMFDGKGMPDMNAGGSKGAETEFQQAFSALYGLVYSLKMSPKKDDAPAKYQNFKVAPPEGLWWVAGAEKFDYATAKPEDWRWTLMIRVPDWVSAADVQHFAEQMEAKKHSDVYEKVRLERYHEGPSVQLMHIGSYDSETPNIEKLHAYAAAQGYQLHGKHHEIYFGDPRRSAPEKLRTVLRQPVSN